VISPEFVLVGNSRQLQIMQEYHSWHGNHPEQGACSSINPADTSQCTGAGSLSSGLLVLTNIILQTKCNHMLHGKMLSCTHVWQRLR